SFLLTGDMERPMEQRLLDGQRLTHADVLKVGHHGSICREMGWSLSNDQPDVAPELGASHAVLRLSGRHSQGDLYHQRGRVVEYELAQGDQNQGIVPQPGSRYETAVSGP